MREDNPLPPWFPEVSTGELIYVRRDPRKNSQEPYAPMIVQAMYRSLEMPNLDVIHRGRELIHNVLHADDPRLDDANFMASATDPSAPGVGGVFILNPTRMKHEARLARLEEQVQELRRDRKPGRAREEAAV